MNREPMPWWVPDIRAWATLGMFALVFYVISLIAFVPSVSESELFKTVATLLLGSGAFGLVCAFLWGGSKATTGAIETVNEVAKAAKHGGAPQPVKVVNDPGSPVPVEEPKP